MLRDTLVSNGSIVELTRSYADSWRLLTSSPLCVSTTWLCEWQNTSTAILTEVSKSASSGTGESGETGGTERPPTDIGERLAHAPRAHLAITRECAPPSPDE